MTNATVTALVLAGKRDGALDPLAAAAGVTHKCLVPVAGRPLIAHVVEALAAAPSIGQIVVSVDDPASLDGVPEIARLGAARRLRLVEARPHLVDSVVDSLRNVRFPALITTADNVLLTPGAVDDLVARAGEDDVLVAMATRESVFAAHPDGQRRFYRFRDGAYSNCNLYWLSSRRTLQVADVFRGGGQFAKHPARIVAAFGLLNLLRFRLGREPIDGLFERLSRRFGVSMRPVIVGDGALAIDVDNERTHAVAAELLERRRERRRAA